MYQQVTFSMFVDAFHRMDRCAQFCAYYEEGKPVGAYDALRVIYDYLEDTQDDPYELDVIAICCDFNHDTEDELVDQFGITHAEDESRWIAVREYLQDQGVYVGETEYGFVYLQH